MVEGHGQEVAWLDALVEQVRHWHQEILAVSGGVAGEHTAQLVSSCARPFQTAFGNDVFPTDVEKAAALRVRMLGEVAIEAASSGLAVDEVAFWFRKILDL